MRTVTSRACEGQVGRRWIQAARPEGLDGEQEGWFLIEFFIEVILRRS